MSWITLGRMHDRAGFACYILGRKVSRFGVSQLNNERRLEVIAVTGSSSLGYIIASQKPQLRILVLRSRANGSPSR